MFNAFFTDTGQQERPKVNTTKVEALGTSTAPSTTGRRKRQEEEITKPIGKVKGLKVKFEKE